MQNNIIEQMKQTICGCTSPVDYDAIVPKLLTLSAKLSTTKLDHTTELNLTQLITQICTIWELDTINLANGMIDKFNASKCLSSLHKFNLVCTLLASNRIPDKSITGIFKYLKMLDPNQLNSMQLLVMLLKSYWHRTFQHQLHSMEQPLCPFDPLLTDKVLTNHLNTDAPVHRLYYPGICWQNAPVIILLLSEEDSSERYILNQIKTHLAHASLPTIWLWQQRSHYDRFVKMLKTVNFDLLKEAMADPDPKFFNFIKTVIESHPSKRGGFEDFQYAVLKLFLEYYPNRFKMCLQHPSLLLDATQLNMMMLYREDYLEFLLDNTSYHYRDSCSFSNLPTPKNLAAVLIEELGLSKKVVNISFDTPDWNLWDIALYKAKSNGSYPKDYENYYFPYYGAPSNCNFKKLLNFPELCKSINCDTKLVVFAKSNSLHFKENQLPKVLDQLPSDQRFTAYVRYIKEFNSQRFSFLQDVPNILTLGIKNLLQTPFVKQTKGITKKSKMIRKGALRYLKAIPINRLLAWMNYQYDNHSVFIYLACLDNSSCEGNITRLTNNFDPTTAPALFEIIPEMKNLAQKGIFFQFLYLHKKGSSKTQTRYYSSVANYINTMKAEYAELTAPKQPRQKKSKTEQSPPPVAGKGPGVIWSVGKEPMMMHDYNEDSSSHNEENSSDVDQYDSSSAGHSSEGEIDNRPVNLPEPDRPRPRAPNFQVTGVRFDKLKIKFTLHRPPPQENASNGVAREAPKPIRSENLKRM